MTTGDSDMSVERSSPDARRSLRTSKRSDSNSSSGSAGSGYGRKTISNIRPPVTKKSINPDADISGQADEEGSEIATDDDDDSDEKPNGFAPSDGLKRRGHQTGLSLSLANASLGKRGRSPVSEEEVERPMSKMSKTSATADSSNEDDDDNDYNAVDDISDSDEDNDVEELEEQMIIESEEEETSDQLRRGSQSSVDSVFGLDGIEENTLQAANHNFFNELFPDAANTTMGEDDNDQDDATPVRRVRFAEEVQLHSNSSTTTDSDDDDDEDEEISYPDLFLQQDSLDPAFRSLIEQKDHDDRSSDGDSYWDFENEQDVQGLDEDSVSDSGSSGYETDEGETTDEEIIPPRTVSKPNTSLRHNTRNAGRLRATTAPSATPARKASAGVLRRGPLMGSFLVDDDKPIAVVDGHGKHMLFFPAPKHRRQAAQSSVVATSSPAPSSVTAYNMASETESDVGFSQTDPMLSSPANVMMTGFGNSRNRANSHLSSEITGPPEAFFPFTSINSNGLVETDNLDDDSVDEYTDEEENLRIEDFINFGDDSSSDDDAQDQYESTGSNTANEDGKGVETTPQSKRSKIPGFKSRSQSTPTPSNPGSLLEHFDKGVVSSFRRNNDRHKMWTRNSSSVGIKGGRLHVADTPISPLRRRRGGSISSGVGRSPLRPQQNVSNTSPPQPSPHHQFGGPLKKRIQNSNHIKRGRKGTL